MKDLNQGPTDFKFSALNHIENTYNAKDYLFWNVICLKQQERPVSKPRAVKMPSLVSVTPRAQTGSSLLVSTLYYLMVPTSPLPVMV